MIDFSGKGAPGCFDVDIVGAGFCGGTLTVRLARARSLRVALIEGSNRFGLGDAYGTERREHLLNVVAARMSALAEEPNHFLEWLWTNPWRIADVLGTRVGSRDFVPRLVYGRHLTALLCEALASYQGITKVARQVTAIERAPSGFAVRLDNGRWLQARTCVLATGTPRPAPPPGLSPSAASSPRYVGDPWRRGALDHVRDLHTIVIIGSGLTAVDVALSLYAQNPAVSIVMLSRHGRLPQTHSSAPSHGSVVPQTDVNRILGARSLRSALQAFRTSVRQAESAGSDWHSVMDAVRPHVQTLWGGLTVKERQRFLRHLRGRWEAHRHRFAPGVAASVRTMIADRRLGVSAGRLVSIEDDGTRIVVHYRASGADGKPIELVADAVVNCTGPQADYRNLEEPLWQHLITRGLATADVCGLSIATDAEGLLLDASGRPVDGLYALGFLRRSSLYESTAVPELRVQVKHVADRLLENAGLAALAV